MFDLSVDPYEDDPLDTVCDAKAKETQDLYDASQASACAETEWLCQTDTSDINQASGVYSLWSLQGGSGPFTNSSGYPIQVPTKCVWKSRQVTINRV